MKLLLVDIGNSYTKIKLSDNSFSVRFKTKSYSTKEDVSLIIGDTLTSIDGAIISSVSLNKDKVMSDYIKSKFNVDSMIVSKDLKTTVAVNEKENELGPDLISLMEGSAQINKTNLSISLGTATVLILTIDSVFKGCAISPGVLSSLDGLVDSASLIEGTNLDGEYNLLGVDTNTALRTGLFNGFAFLIDGFIDSIKKKYNLDDLDIFMVGGFSNVIAPKLKNKVQLNDNLIYDGLEKIYELNRDK